MDGGANFESFGTPASDAIIDSIRVELDDNKIYDMYKRFQMIMHEEAAELFMFAPTEKIVIHKRFTNADPSSLRPGFYAPAFKLSEN